MGKLDKLKPAYRALIVADIHMSNKLSYSRPTDGGRGMTDRLLDQQRLFERMYKEAIEKQANAIFILGDLFDKPTVDAVTLQAVVSSIMASPVPIFLLPGNHDANSVRGGRFTVEAFSHMGIPACGTKVTVIGNNEGEPVPLQVITDSGKKKGRLRLWSIAFKPLDDTLRDLNRIQELLDKEDFNVLLLHASVTGSENLGWKCDDGLDPDETCEGFDQVLAGHFHTSQRFGNCGLYLGAPMHHNFGDAGREAGFWYFEWKGTSCLMEFIPGGSPSFHTFEEIERPNKEDGIKSGDYVRYEIEATHSEWIKIKAAVKEQCEVLTALGIHTNYKHKPISQHESRLSGDGDFEKSAKMDMETAIEKYTAAVGVVTEGLNSKRLKKMGREILTEARIEDGLA